MQRNIIREFDSLRERGSLQEGVSLGDGRGILRVKRSGCLNDTTRLLVQAMLIM